MSIRDKLVRVAELINTSSGAEKSNVIKRWEWGVIFVFVFVLSCLMVVLSYGYLVLWLSCFVAVL